jgi:hypothetical protein
VHGAANFGKPPQLRRALRTAESIPSIAADAHIARQPALQISESHRPCQTSDVADYLDYVSERLRRGANR